MYAALRFEPTLAVVNSGTKIVPSPAGIYHGAYPDIPDGVFEGVGAKVEKLDALLKKPVAIVSFDNDFTDGFAFPTVPVKEILGRGKTPLIRMLPRSTRAEFARADPIYALEKFLKGDLDLQIVQWVKDAKRVNAPIMVEFGPESYLIPDPLSF